MIDINSLPKIRGTYRENAKLLSWFNVGGNAEIIFRPADIEDLQHFLKTRSKEIPLTILGAASNVIIKDEGIKGVVIRLPASFAKISHKNEIITAGASSPCQNVALYSKEAALSGLEFLTGIPGAVGGAIAMNAGCYGSEVSQILISAKAVDMNGNLISLSNEDFGFSYRENKIAKGNGPDFIFVEGAFKAVKSTRDEVDKKISELNQKRQDTQPIRAKTGGSTFKNPKNLDKKAWQLIDEAGFRGARVGDAIFSEKHCNFMINTGNASAKDLITLGNNARDAVKSKFGVELEWEIKII